MQQSAKFVWPQGEDLQILLRYKEGPSHAAKVVNLSAGYEARMDLVDPNTRAVLYSASSTTGEIGLSSGVGNNEPNIRVLLPRALTLGTGSFAIPQTAAYDVFLRNLTTNIQVKVLKGTITVERSNTLWI